MLTSCVYAVMYFCLGVSTAVFSEDWKNLENTSMGSGESGDTPDDVIMLISDSLAAASVRYNNCYIQLTIFYKYALH